jgi:sigma-B regulation protein RsbU (phosphoserine phosphatase)
MAKVLVVEDDSGIALGLEDALRLEGHQVERATSGAIASRRAIDETFDLILLDVLLPGKNGFEVCREVRACGLDTPIIFLSALAQESDRVSGLNLGANDYVVKPFSSSELMARVRGLLRYAEHSRQSRRRFEGELEDARRVQERLVPFSLPAVEGLDYAGMCSPANGVSGDYYDFFELPSGCLAMLLVDVCGKGMPAALLAASLHAAVRACAPAADKQCGALLTHVNRLLFEATAEDRFATMFYSVYDPGDRTLTWTNAGHCPPWWVRSPRSLIRLDALTAPVGLLPTIDAAERTEHLAPGDRVVIVSDGITESRNPAGKEFGERRVGEVVWQNGDSSASRLCAALLDEVREFTRGCRQHDDQTVVAAVLTER